MTDEQQALLSPVTLAGRTLKNRLGVAPMTRVTATEDGRATETMTRYYERFARGGFGLVITEGIYTDQAHSQGYAFQPGRHDVGNALVFQKAQHRLVEEAAVGTQKTDNLVAQMVQGRFEELKDIVGAVRMAWPQPEIGHHPGFGNKSQQRVVANASMTVGVVAARSALLVPVAGDHGRIDIQRHPLQGANLAEEPAIDLGLHALVGEHVKARKQPHDGLVSRPTRPARS